MKSEFLVIIRKASIEILAHQSRYFYQVLQGFSYQLKAYVMYFILRIRIYYNYLQRNE